MLELIVVIFLFVGILLVIIDTIRARYKNEQPKIVYRYIPRTLDEYLKDEPLVTDIFKKMFQGPDPWINGVDVIDEKQQRDIQRGFMYNDSTKNIEGVRQ